MQSNNMNIVAGIIAIIYEFHKIATWSREFKGDSIELMDDDTKAMCLGTAGGHSIRANFSIEPGQIVSWELECYQTWYMSYFYGVISSKQKKFDTCPNDSLDSAYGTDDYTDRINYGSIYIKTTTVQNGVDMKWNKPEFPYNTVFKLKLTADWREKQCKLSIFYQGKKLNDTNNDYTILLPVLDDDEVLYPCVTPFNQGAYCVIRYV